MPKSIPNPQRLQAALERRILHGLECEWENAYWLLPELHQQILKQPLFSLRDMQSRLGCWNPEKNEIALSRRLVLDYPWQAVRDVLVHEMAHQVADQLLGDQVLSDQVIDDGTTGSDPTPEPPHGPRFLQACRLLHANPEATTRYQTLSDTASDGALDFQDKMLLRVKKLLALSASRNRHEAEAAMAKAHQLIAKYNIDLRRQKRTSDYTSRFLGRPGLRHFREAYRMAHLLQEFYFVHTIWASAYVVAKGKMGRVLEISGTTHNVRLAGYVYDFVTHFIDAQWQRYNHQKKLNRYRKTDFAVGLIEGFMEKLRRRQVRDLDIIERSLIRIEDPELRAYVKYRYPRIRSFRRGGVHQDPDVTRDGHRIGREMVISQGITEKKQGPPGLIEHQ